MVRDHPDSRLWTVFWGLFENRRSLEIQTAQSCFKRFDDIAANDDSALFAYRGLRQQAGPEELKTARRYFNLCSEELGMVSMKAVPKEVWAVWKKTMTATMGDATWAECWKSLRSEYGGFPEFREFMDGIVAKP